MNSINADTRRHQARKPHATSRHAKKAANWAALAGRSALVCLLASSQLSACGGGGGSSSGGSITDTANRSNSSPTAASSDISRSTAPYTTVDPAYYAAARFLDHASFGPTTKEIAALTNGSFASWIDAQLALPASRIDNAQYRDSEFNNPGQYVGPQQQFYGLALSAPDQLRLRVSWALMQLVVVSQSRVSGFASSEYFNMLQQKGLGKYRDLLRSVTLHATMGFFQDNAQNRRAGAVPGATANENFARELMQLFSIGLVELNQDGSPKLDANGKTVATYTQRHVSETARALTGWVYDVDSSTRPRTDFGNFATPLKASTLFHDTDAKQIIGERIIPAGGTPASDLEVVLDALSTHPNLAPFISMRLIQHLVTGDPSPAYVSRIAGVFRSSDGDLATVVRAILLDPDARKGDNPGAAAVIKGKVKEPLLVRTQLLRAFNCQKLPLFATYPSTLTPGQPVFVSPTVFNFYPPNFKIPGTTTTAPEFKLVTGAALQNRAGDIRNGYYTVDRGEAWRAAGCSTAEWDAAQAAGAEDAAALISKRLFRGAMPLYVKEAIVVGAMRRTWEQDLRIYDAVGLAALSPSWGVMK